MRSIIRQDIRQAIPTKNLLHFLQHIMKFQNLFFVFGTISIHFCRAISVEDDLTLTAKEQNALEQFKPLVLNILPHNYMKTDIYLIKWLRASKLNLKATREMLVNNLHWREENGMDTILEEDFSEFEMDFPVTSTGADYDGRPLSTINAANWDVRKAVVTGNVDQFMRYLYRLLETGVQRIYDAQSRGENVTQGTTLMNIRGFNLIQHACVRCITIYVNLVLAFENHYPGMAHKIVLINTPSSFEIILTAVRPVMSKETRDALTIFGNDKQQWMSYILSMVPPDQLDHEFGGDKFD